VTIGEFVQREEFWFADLCPPVVRIRAEQVESTSRRG
jgi:hypothetical protein